MFLQQYIWSWKKMLWTGPWYTAKHLGMPHFTLKQPGPLPRSFSCWDYVNFSGRPKHLFLFLGSRLLEEPPARPPTFTPYFQFIPTLLPQRSPGKPRPVILLPSGRSSTSILFWLPKPFHLCPEIHSEKCPFLFLCAMLSKTPPTLPSDVPFAQNVNFPTLASWNPTYLSNLTGVPDAVNRTGSKLGSHHLLALRPWARHSTTLSHSLVIFKMRIQTKDAWTKSKSNPQAVMFSPLFHSRNQSPIPSHTELREYCALLELRIMLIITRNRPGGFRGQGAPS